MTYWDARAEFERTYWRGVLDAAGGKVAKAAEIAKFDRKELYKKLVRVGIREPRSREGGNDLWRELGR